MTAKPDPCASMAELVQRLRHRAEAAESRLVLLEKAAGDVLFDHDERQRVYPDTESQPNKVAVMEALRALVSPGGAV